MAPLRQGELSVGLRGFVLNQKLSPALPAFNTYLIYINTN